MKVSSYICSSCGWAFLTESEIPADATDLMCPACFARELASDLGADALPLGNDEYALIGKEDHDGHR